MNARSASPLRNDYLDKPIVIANIIPQTNKFKKQLLGLVKQNLPRDYQHASKQQRVYYFSDGALYRISEQASQGIFFASRGPLIFYHRQGKHFHGTAHFVYPQGIHIEANFYKGKLHKWCTILAHNRFIACHYYYYGVMEKTQYHYCYLSEVLVESVYERGTIVKIAKGRRGTLEQLIENQELQIKTLLRRLTKGQFKHPSSIIQPSIRIDCDVIYFGQQIDGVPNGYGAMLGLNEFYVGVFKEGSLNGISSVLFPNGISYYGEMALGKCTGIGRFQYGNTLVYKSKSKIIRQEEFQSTIGELQWINQTVNSSWLPKQQLSTVNGIHNLFWKSYYDQEFVIPEDSNKMFTFPDEKSSRQRDFSISNPQDQLFDSSISQSRPKKSPTRTSFHSKEPLLEQSNTIHKNLKITRTPNISPTWKNAKESLGDFKLDQLTTPHYQIQRKNGLGDQSYTINLCRANKEVCSMVKGKLQENPSQDEGQILPQRNDMIYKERPFFKANQFPIKGQRKKQRKKIFNHDFYQREIDPNHYLPYDSSVREQIQDIMINHLRQPQ